MKMIPSREELIEQVAKIIEDHIDIYGHIEDDIVNAAEEIVDLLEKRTSVSQGEYLNIP